MSLTRLLLLCCLPLAAPLVTGCTAPAEPVEPTIARVTAETPGDYDLLWDAVGDTLRRYYFQPDRQDRHEGIIVSRPDTSANWFEWWRPQPQPAYYWSEANLHTIQRRATVHLKTAESPGAYDVDVQIDRYRYSLEERQIDNAAAALRLYSGSTPTESGRTEKQSEDAYWIRLGRDASMERSVLASIIRRYGRTIVTDTQPEDLVDQR